MHLLVFLFVGLVIGALARFVVPGRDPGGWLISMMVGVGGAVLGGYLGHVVGLYREGEPAGFVVSLLSAIALVVAYRAVAQGRSRAA
jgi:uncharacterized membrane protein YeaQ/YmgE (transglycosylase-associated protein family)